MPQENEKYMVRLLFEVPAPSHRDAVERVIDNLARYGIIDWVYRAQRIADGTFEHFNGDLEPVDFEEMRKTAEEHRAQGEQEQQDEHQDD